MRYLWIAFLVFVLLWVCWNYGERFLWSPARIEEEVRYYPARDFLEIAREIAPSVVAIEATVYGGSRGRDHRRLGSGLIIDSNGLILTNRHLVEGASDLEVTLWDGRRFKPRYST